MADAAGRLDLNDGSLTENTRACYPLEAVANAKADGRGAVPKHVVMLTADAFGVLPPIARLSPAQAMYQFLSGYTAKVAGTEKGLGKEPQATFSTCFGAPFLPRRPEVYGELLKAALAESGAQVWLINTGWTGGAYGVGKRISIAHTRALLAAALGGALEGGGGSAATHTSGWRCRCLCRASLPTCSTRARRGRTLARTPRRRGTWSRGSPRISRRSRAR